MADEKTISYLEQFKKKCSEYIVDKAIEIFLENNKAVHDETE